MTAGTITSTAAVGNGDSVDTPRPLATRCHTSSAGDDPDGDPDHEAHGRDRRGLPCHRGPHLSAREPERLEDRELAPAAAHAGDESVAHGEQREGQHEDRQRHRQPSDLAEAADLGRDGGTGRRGQLRRGADPAFDRRPVGAGSESPDERACEQVLVEERCVAGTGERRAVCERLGLTEAGEHRGAHDAVVARGAAPGDVDRVADVLAEHAAGWWRRAPPRRVRQGLGHSPRPARWVRPAAGCTRSPSRDARRPARSASTPRPARRSRAWSPGRSHSRRRACWR